MEWSIYNYDFIDSKGVLFIYNSFTNNLLKIAEEKRKDILFCKKGDFSHPDKDFVEQLIRESIIVENNRELYKQIKLERLLSRYNTRYLSLTIAPTLNCNFRCVYCYEKGRNNETLATSETLIDDIVDFVESFDSTERLRITWYGGEPLLKFDFIQDLTRRFLQIRSDYDAFIITNGYLLNSRVIKSLSDLHIRGIQITLDGLEETHNKRRPHVIRNNSFQTIIHNMDELFDIYPDVSVYLRVNVDKTNEDEYHQLYQFLNEKYGKYKIFIHPGYVTDDFSETSNGACMLQEERNTFVIDQYDKYGLPMQMYPKTSFGECCARHISSFVIGPNGELYKCWNDIGIKDKEIGHLNSFSLFDKNCLTYMLDNDPLESEECEQCFFFPICHGGCPYNRIYKKESDSCTCFKNNLKRMLLRRIKKETEDKL
ncbi:MAG: radical SAM protein [Prevotella sp.]|nr:radical SAM protein [Prevotella sp.]